MPSPAQVAANQTNAKLSTGPVTEQGKAAVAKNALKTGLTGRTVLLATDDAEMYAKHIASFRVRYSPVGEAETELVQSIADAAWRLARIPSLEAGIYAIGRVKLAALHPNEQDPQTRSMLIETEVFLAYERQLRNLQTQEARLRRHIEKDTAALKGMQQQRISETSKRLTKAAQLLVKAIETDHLETFSVEQFGFEFSLEQIKTRAEELYPHLTQPCPTHGARKAA